MIDYLCDRCRCCGCGSGRGLRTQEKMGLILRSTITVRLRIVVVIMTSNYLRCHSNWSRGNNANIVQSLIQRKFQRAECLTLFVSEAINGWMKAKAPCCSSHFTDRHQIYVDHHHESSITTGRGGETGGGPAARVTKNS